ncbi:iron ABC transporter substrate-binding protein [Candidatus Synechococcus calcipolaris G9]|uniref:Iron ABC transporter substrate-binding protein n=1 Tax=Candidatus Synechococcus calcipolaris G9 TaxID=1497997 RepID=A0ABT6EX15_9SYNE|nr:iron ABC transporter substrate-binding protein [Candidatus Synechococcus calcipolaris]MDG2990329.1 iron ABC transporter substrate-binding protein [Candidatus Synechococcus calcipolaris G9]
MVALKPVSIATSLLATLTIWGLGLASSVLAQTLTIYSGRGESLIGPLIEQAEKDLGFDIEVRYGDTSELAISILEEGRNSPADLFFGQDAGALGALAREGRTVTIPSRILNKVDERFRSPKGQWVGISGRSRVINYNTNMVSARDLPKSIWELTQPKWRGKVAWAPTNGSFQAFVTALRLTEGDARTLEWLQAMKNNGAVVYRNNTTIVEAVGRGEIELGLVNNYYLHRFLAENPDFPVGQHYTRNDAGSMVNIAGVAVLDTSDQPEQVFALIDYLLRPESQDFFAQKNAEYPLVTGIAPPANQLPINEINPPRIDLSDLADLDGTLQLLQRAGVL